MKMPGAVQACAALIVLGLSACALPNEPLTEAAAEISRPMSSGEILQELYVINTGEIELAQLALAKSDNPEVLRTAQLIIRDHTALNERTVSLARAAGVELDSSLLSRGTAFQAAAIRDALADLSGAEFNREYLARNIELHEIALQTVRTDLLPSAESRAVEELLAVTAPQLEQHLLAAKESYASVTPPRSPG